MTEENDRRESMVRDQLEGRGIRDERVLAAFRAVPRELFVPEALAEFAYDDAPLPIEAGQTISQPYIVALMAAALRTGPRDRVLEVGTGSGYAAAILGRVAGEVYTIERHAVLARVATERLARLGAANVHVREGDGSLGWPEEAPFDAIIVAAGGPGIPPSLVEQLRPGGCLVMPVGEGRDCQKLVRATRQEDGSIATEDLGDVRFVPLVGAHGWSSEEEWDGRPARGRSRPATLARLVREDALPIDRIEGLDLGGLLERIGDARLVLIGEATHGTSEFYRLRAEISRALIERAGFDFVAVEADWPDAQTLDRWVKGRAPAPRPPGEGLVPFARFPTWMWRNRETADFLAWLRAWNEARPRGEGTGVGFHGLDLYSLFTSIQAVVRFLDRIDPEAAETARRRYACLSPWEADPAAYGRATLYGRYRVCEQEAVAMLRDLMAHRVDYALRDGDAVFDAVQNARLVADAERYYRAMYAGGSESWNLRDQHMVDTLIALLDRYGPRSRAVVWAHNSHLGDASATEMSVRGEHNVGQLCRARYGDSAYLIGFGTDRGTVAAASDWDAPMEVMQVRPARAESYERICHDAGVPAFFLPLRRSAREALRYELEASRLERAIGVIYRPESELQSHYFHASLPRQFDEYVWIDQTHALEPVSERTASALPKGHPFGASA